MIHTGPYNVVLDGTIKGKRGKRSPSTDNGRIKRMAEKSHLSSKPFCGLKIEKNIYYVSVITF